jgi:phosphoglycolate phosphatase-like HAD superfamily hydrolase
MIKGILFDKDGTLLEFLELWHGIIRNVLKALKDRYFLSKETIDELKRISGFQKHKFDKESMIQYLATTQIADLWCEVINRDSDKITYKALMELFEEKAGEENLVITALEGVKELLNYLKEKGYTLGVATADTKESTHNGLRKSGLIDYFDYIGCNEEDATPKPSPDMAIQFCQIFKLKSEEVLIVGDSVTDMEFADNAKVQFIGIKTEYNDYGEFIKRKKPVVDNIYDIINVMQL